MGEIYGGFLGSHFLSDDIYYCYGNAFGTKYKVIIITKNFRANDKKAIKNLTTSIHDAYVMNSLNPLCSDQDSELVLEMFKKTANNMLYKISCDFLSQRNKSEQVEYRPSKLVITEQEEGLGKDEDEMLGKIIEVEENLEVSGVVTENIQI